MDVARSAVDMTALDARGSSLDDDATNRSPPPKHVRDPPVTAAAGILARIHPDPSNVTRDDSDGHASRPMRSSANARLNSPGIGRPSFWSYRRSTMSVDTVANSTSVHPTTEWTTLSLSMTTTSPG